MGKRFKYFVSSIISALGFFLYMSLPVESRYFGLMAGIVLVIFCFWFGLGIIFTDDFYTRMMSIILPTMFFLGFGLFAVLLPGGLVLQLSMSAIFVLAVYFMFLVENLFLVAIGFKTVPLYRAAYTVSLIMLLVTAFFLFDSMYSFKLYYWMNFIIMFLISTLLFFYQFWSVSIELPDDGKTKPLGDYVMAPSLIMAEMAAVFSFIPTGIFKGSIYLVAVFYIMAGLIQSSIRERLFKRVWMQYVYITLALVLAVLVTTQWR